MPLVCNLAKKRWTLQSVSYFLEHKTFVLKLLVHLFALNMYHAYLPGLKPDYVTFSGLHSGLIIPAQSMHQFRISVQFLAF